MKRVFLPAVAIFLLLSGGCAKRSVANRIVFTASSSPLTATGSPEAAGVLTLAEPQIQEPEEGSEPPLPETPETPRTRPRVRLTPPDPVTETEAVPEPLPAVEVPLLEPQGGPAEQAQRQQILQFQDRIHGRISRQENARLSADDRRMLDDARTFLSQSQRALATNDFKRALTLARKASMLLAVIEQE